MSTSLLQAEFLETGDRSSPPLTLAPGGALHCRVPARSSSAIFLDELLLLRAERQFFLEITWFGVQEPVRASRAHYGILQKVFPVVPGGGLPANINLAENILLPALFRHAEPEATVGRRLLDFISSDSSAFGLAPEEIVKLPHQVAPAKRFLAMVLQAWLAAPAVIIISDAALPHAEFWPVLAPSCLWLRQQLPDAAWLFLTAETSLPPEFSPGIVAPA